MKTDNELIAEFMGFPKVTVGSSWDYNRHFDHASITKNLIVKEVDDIKNAEFEQKMPFTKYGLEAFDGIIFRPSGYPEYSLSKFHCPARPYRTSWGWLMPVVEKIEEFWELGIGRVMNFDIESGCTYSKKTEVRIAIMLLVERNPYHSIRSESESKIEAVYKAVVEFIKWHNTQKH